MLTWIRCEICFITRVKEHRGITGIVGCWGDLKTRDFELAWLERQTRTQGDPPHEIKLHHCPFNFLPFSHVNSKKMEQAKRLRIDRHPIYARASPLKHLLEHLFHFGPNEQSSDAKHAVMSANTEALHPIIQSADGGISGRGQLPQESSSNRRRRSVTAWTQVLVIVVSAQLSFFFLKEMWVLWISPANRRMWSVW